MYTEKQGSNALHMFVKVAFFMHNTATSCLNSCAAGFGNRFGNLWILDSNAVISKVFRLGCTIKTTESVLSAI